MRARSPRQRALRAPIALAFLALVGSYERAAQACSEPSCTAPIRLFAQREVPGNLVYFEVLVDDPGPLTLRKADGTPIAASIRTIGADRVFAPDEPIEPYTRVTLEYTPQCSDTPAEPQSLSFLTGSLEEPTLGELSARVVFEELVMNEATGALEHVVQVAFWPTSSAYLEHLVSTRVTLGDLPVSGTADGTIEVRTSCQPRQADATLTPCGDGVTVPEGVHVVEVSAHVVGAEEQPAPVALEVVTDCDNPLGANAIDEPKYPAIDGPIPYQPRPRPVRGDPGFQHDASWSCSAAPGVGGARPALVAALLGAFALFRRRRAAGRARAS